MLKTQKGTSISYRVIGIEDTSPLTVISELLDQVEEEGELCDTLQRRLPRPRAHWTGQIPRDVDRKFLELEKTLEALEAINTRRKELCKRRSPMRA